MISNRHMNPLAYRPLCPYDTNGDGNCGRRNCPYCGEIPQLNIHPSVVAAPSVLCVGGPCHDQRMQCPVGFVLIVIRAIDGLRATAMLPERIALAKALGGYVGHYSPGDDVLLWEGD